MTHADPARISPTAHYTGYVWYRHGLSFPALVTRQGAALYRSLQPINGAYALLRGGPSLETLLLLRHRIIDDALDAEIAAGRVGQVVEIAAGLSPRGLSFARRYPQLRYVEGDLPGMSALKARRLGSDRPANLEIRAMDALADAGPDSLGALALEPGRGTAVITEGLVNYFPEMPIRGLWARIARCLRDAGGGLYLSDIHLQADFRRSLAARAFRRALGVFARGQIHVHFEDDAACRDAFAAAGFDRIHLHRPTDAPSPAGRTRPERLDLLRVAEARVE